MRVLAVDPGYDRLGVAILEHKNSKEVLIYSTCILTDKSLSVPLRLGEIGVKLEELFKTYTPDGLAVETLFFNKNQKTAIGVAQARGVAVYIAYLHQCKIFEFGPQEVKIAVTGYGKSDKKAVIDMILRLVPNIKEGALDDEYDAIAVGITCLTHHKG